MTDSPGGSPTPTAGPEVNEKSATRGNIGRDAVGGVALLLAVFAPWNLQFGFGVAGSSSGMLGVLIGVTALSWVSIAATHAGRHRLGARVITRLRFGLNLAYLLFAAAIVLWDVVVTVIYGSSGTVPSGVGPGVWMGVTGALLCAQPVLSSTRGQSSDWFGAARIVGVVAVAFGVQSFLLNMYWRIQSVGSVDAIPADGAQHFGYLAAAAVYGALSLAIVVIAAWWMIINTESSRLAVVGLGAATLLSALAVWASDAGLHIVPAQGAVNNTSSGIGFQGYLLWCAAAAIFAPTALRDLVTRRPFDSAVVREAMRRGLGLVAVWCGGMIAVRLVYFGLAAASDLDLSLPITSTMIAANLVAGGVALWLRALLASTSASPIRVASVSGGLFVLMAIRIAVDIWQGAQHITTTFNVVLCLLAMVIAAIARLSLADRRSATATGGVPVDSAPRIFVTSSD